MTENENTPLTVYEGVQDSYVRSAKLVRVVDGDTIDFQVDLGFDMWKKERVRVLGVDTKEIPPFGRAASTPDQALALECRDRVQALLEGAQEIVVQTFKGDLWGKYGRLLAEVYFDGKKLTDWIRANPRYLKD